MGQVVSGKNELRLTRFNEGKEHDSMERPLDVMSSPEEKIAFFRSLFRGRDDVYPRRFESRKTGKSGYSPVCANEWVRGVCDKRKVKCVECPNRSFLPVTDDVIRKHLTGVDDSGRDFVAGVYPMLIDETCYFLAVDFDKESWRDDIRAVSDTCRELGIPLAVERSRSGNGAHLWIFFENAIPPMPVGFPSPVHDRSGSLSRRTRLGLGCGSQKFQFGFSPPSGDSGAILDSLFPRGYRKRTSESAPPRPR